MIELSQLKTQKPFGQELLEKEVISQEELATALSLQHQSVDRIGKLFIDIGAISEADLVGHLSAYLGIPYVTAEDLSQVPVLEGTFSANFMRECKFIPIKVEDEKQTDSCHGQPPGLLHAGHHSSLHRFPEPSSVFWAPKNAISRSDREILREPGFDPGQDRGGHRGRQ